MLAKQEAIKEIIVCYVVKNQNAYPVDLLPFIPRNAPSNSNMSGSLSIVLQSEIDIAQEPEEYTLESNDIGKLY